MAVYLFIFLFVGHLNEKKKLQLFAHQLFCIPNNQDGEQGHLCCTNVDIICRYQ